MLKKRIEIREMISDSDRVLNLKQYVFNTEFKRIFYNVPGVWSLVSM